MAYYPGSFLLEVWGLASHPPLSVLLMAGKDYHPHRLVVVLFLWAAAATVQVLAKVTCGSILHDYPGSSDFEVLPAYCSQSTANC